MSAKGAPHDGQDTVQTLCLAHHVVHLWRSPRRWSCGATNPVQIRWKSRVSFPLSEERWLSLIIQNRWVWCVLGWVTKLNLFMESYLYRHFCMDWKFNARVIDNYFKKIVQFTKKLAARPCKCMCTYIYIDIQACLAIMKPVFRCVCPGGCC